MHIFVNNFNFVKAKILAWEIYLSLQL